MIALCSQPWKDRLIITEHRDVLAAGMLEMKVNPFLFAQALEEMQIGFLVLHAVVACEITTIELEAIGAGKNAVSFQDACQDGGYATPLEDALIVAMP